MAAETGSRAWEATGESGQAGVALEVRVGQKCHILLSRGCPARTQGDRGVREFRMGMLGSDNGVSVMG